MTTESQEQCVVCLEDKVACRPFSCMHNVCGSCVQTMQRFDHSACPLCRAAVLQMYELTTQTNHYYYEDEFLDEVAMAGVRAGQQARETVLAFVRRMRRLRRRQGVDRNAATAGP